MVILIVCKAPSSLRGRLTRWLLQIKSGVYVGTLSSRVRERLWMMTVNSVRQGWAILLMPAKNEQGFDILSHGKPPVVFEDLEGIWMAKTRKTP